MSKVLEPSGVGSIPTEATMEKEDRLYVDTCSGIYYFKNLLKNKYYIGQAINTRKRLIHHLGNLLHNRYNAPLYRALQKYGIENFEFGILQRVEEDELFLKDILNFWERYYITLYNSYGATGYNQTRGGDAGVLGLKMTEEQKRVISQNAKKEANDGRHKVFCYDIEKKVTIQCPTLKALSTYLNIKLSRNVINNLLIANKYIIARSLVLLHDKIEKYNNRAATNINNKRNSDGKFHKKITDEAVQDILNGMRQKDWTIKYNFSKASYSKTKQNLIKQGKMDYTRVYTKKVSKEEFLEYMKDHSIKEAAEHFDVCTQRIYKYKNIY